MIKYSRKQNYCFRIGETMDRLSQKRLFLLDMDGTVYLGDQIIPGADGFIRRLRQTGRDYIFMTNNSSRAASDYLEKLHRLGIPAEKENVFPSGQAAAFYLNDMKKSPRIYLVGTEALKRELESMGIEVSGDGKGQIDFLLVGYDTELNYEKLRVACRLLCEDVPFYATNPDWRCPAENGRYLPDCACICYSLTQATEKTPFYIGKPRAEMALEAVKSRGFTPADAAVIGDRLYTDVKCGLNAGIFSVLVLSGESTREDIQRYGITPDLVLDSVARIEL